MKNLLLSQLLFVGVPLMTVLIRESTEVIPTAAPAPVSPAAGRGESDAAPKKNSSPAPTAPAARHQPAAPKHLFM